MLDRNRIAHRRVSEPAAPRQEVRNRGSVLRDLRGDTHQITFLRETEILFYERTAVGKLKGNFEPIAGAGGFKQRRVGIRRQRLSLEVNREGRRHAPLAGL